jgi:peptidoglycan/LPS O-acetylase OafA/YrhL
MAEIIAKQGKISSIQGLRGVAVVLVVFGHYGLFFGSGFVGVDIFFVISGWVVTASVLRSQGASGKFQLYNFLRARLVRLAPALTGLTLTVALFQIFYSPKFEWSSISEQSIWSLLWVSNVYAEINLGDYFGEIAGGGLLTHT